MQSLAELDLPHLPIEDPAFTADPFPFFAAARARHPWLASSSFGHFVTEFQAMRELFMQDDKLRPSSDGVIEQLGARDSIWGRWATEHLLMATPEQHRRVRDALASSFTPRSANALRSRMRETITHLLDEWVSRGSFDFEEFASWFPISVLFLMLGAPAERIGPIKADLEVMGLAFSMDRDLVPALDEAVVRLDVFVQDLIAERRSCGPSDGVKDLLDLAVDTRDAGVITTRELSANLIALMMAAYDTSKNVLTTTMSLLIERPEMYRRCAEDLDYCRRTIEETLRYMSTSTAFRFTTQEVIYRDVLLPEHTMLFFPFSVSGRDAAVFPDGERFDPDRPDISRHIAFGLGRHMCLGQHIARVQLQEALHLVAQRLREPKLAGPHGWRPFPGIWGLKGLPITFTPA
jgi:cytochrome P450